MHLFNKSTFRLFIIFLLIYACFAKFDGWPDNSRIDLTRAIVDEGRFEIDSYAGNTGDRAYYNGHYYSDKFPGASFLAIPPYFIFKHVFGVPEIINNFEERSDSLYYGMIFFIILCTSVFFSALTVILIFKITGLFFSKKSYQYMLAIAYGIGTMAFNYATLFFDNAIATFFSFLAFYIIYTSLKNNSFSKFKAFFAGLAIGMSILTTMFAFVIFIGLFFYLLLKKQFSKIVPFVIGCLLFILILLFYNYSIFNNFDLAYAHTDKEIFGMKFLLIEQSAYHHNLEEKSFFNYALYKLYLTNNNTYSDNIIVESKLINNQTVLEINSIGESFTLSMIDNKTLYYERNYSMNGRLLSFEFKFIKMTNSTTVYFKENHFTNWTLLYNYTMNGSEYLIKDYVKGLNYITDCPVEKSNLKQDIVCRFSLFTSDGTLINTFEDTYDLFNESDLNGLISKKYSFSRKRVYNHSTFFSNIVKILFYPYRSLFLYSPILIFAFVGFFFVNRKNLPEFLLSGFIFLSLLCLHALVLFYWGGHSFGPRYLSLAIPFLFIPLIFALKKINKKVFLIVLLVSILVNLFGMQPLEQKYVGAHHPQLVFEEELWNNLYSWKSTGNVLLEYYIPLFFSEGPDSFLLEKMFSYEFPSFLNLLILFMTIILIVYFPKLK